MTAVRRCRNWPEVGRLLLRGHEPTNLVLRNGVRVAGPESPLPLVEEVFTRRVYNPAELPIDPQDVVVDIGANVGVFTLFAARQTRNRVLSFEPLPENCEQVRRNVEANSFSNVTVSCQAVAGESGTQRLYLSESAAGHLLFDHSDEGDLTRYVEVECTTLPVLMDEHELSQIGFLKLDCEGSEGAILSSTPSEYLARIEKIAMEFHDNVSVLDHDALADRLQEAGFATRVAWNGESQFGYLYGWRP
jgi:FkbM family methyltransferase